MANHKTGAQRYNDRMDKIFARSKELNEKYHGKDSFGSSKEKVAKKMKHIVANHYPSNKPEKIGKK